MPNKIVDIERGQIYRVTVDNLWEQDINEWENELENEIDLKSVRKTVYEGRGCLEFEFDKTTPVKTVQTLTEAQTQTDPKPIVGKVYRVKEGTKITVSPQGNSFSYEPIDLEEGTKFHVTGEMSDRSWQMAVLNGTHEGIRFSMNEDEWLRASTNIKGVGKLLDSGPLDVEQDDDEGANSIGQQPDEPGKGANPFSQAGAYKNLQKAFPEFPDKRPADAYWNMDLPEEPIPQPGGGMGGGF